MKNKKYLTVELRLELSGLRSALATSIEIVLMRCAQDGKIEEGNIPLLKNALLEDVNGWLDQYKTTATDNIDD